jgi:hypothetical protein
MFGRTKKSLFLINWLVRWPPRLAAGDAPAGGSEIRLGLINNDWPAEAFRCAIVDAPGNILEGDEAWTVSRRSGPLGRA